MAMEKDILVSIVIPTYSRNLTLKRALESVFTQTHKNIEIIIIDDNSPDSEWRLETEKMMEEYRNDSRVHYIQNPKNLGGAVARNVGILASKGDYIAFLDDDDEYFPERIEKQLECFINTTQNNLALVFCDAVMTYDNDKFVCDVKPRYRGCCLFEAMRDNCLAATSQWMAKKQCLEAVGLFSDVPCKQDSTLILKLLGHGYEVECVPMTLSRYCNYSGVRISSTGIKNLNGELLYKSKCEEYYDRLSQNEIKEVEYSFAKRLYKLYSANKMRKEKKKCLYIMFTSYPLKSLSYFTINTMKSWIYAIRDRGMKSGK